MKAFANAATLAWVPLTARQWRSNLKARCGFVAGTVPARAVYFEMQNTKARHHFSCVAASLEEGKELGGLICKVCGRSGFGTLSELKRHFHQLHERELWKVHLLLPAPTPCLSMSACGKNPAMSPVAHPRTCH